MTNEQMDPCRDDGLCSSCADALRCAACGEYLPEHEDDCDREFVAAAECWVEPGGCSFCNGSGSTGGATYPRVVTACRRCNGTGLAAVAAEREVA